MPCRPSQGWRRRPCRGCACLAYVSGAHSHDRSNGLPAHPVQQPAGAIPNVRSTLTALDFAATSRCPRPLARLKINYSKGPAHASCRPLHPDLHRRGSLAAPPGRAGHPVACVRRKPAGLGADPRLHRPDVRRQARPAGPDPSTHRGPRRPVDLLLVYRVNRLAGRCAGWRRCSTSWTRPGSRSTRRRSRSTPRVRPVG
jgi:hypothetical protein